MNLEDAPGRRHLEFPPMDRTEGHLPRVDQRLVKLGWRGCDGPRTAPWPFATAIRLVSVTVLCDVKVSSRVAGPVVRRVPPLLSCPIDTGRQRFSEPVRYGSGDASTLRRESVGARQRCQRRRVPRSRDLVAGLRQHEPAGPQPTAQRRQLRRRRPQRRPSRATRRMAKDSNARLPRDAAATPRRRAQPPAGRRTHRDVTDPSSHDRYPTPHGVSSRPH